MSTMVLTGAMASAQEAIQVERPVYEELGVSPTVLFAIMLTFTIFLIIILVGVSKSTANVIRFKFDKVKKGAGLIALLLVSTQAFSQEVAEENSEYLMNFPDSAFWAFMIFDVILVMLILYFVGQMKGALVEYKGAEKPVTFFSRWNKQLTNAVPIEDEDTIMLDHDYDGIQELDNDLPPWWKYGFYITIVWAFIYIPYYHVFNQDKLQYGEYAAEMEEGEKEVAAYKAAHPELVNEDNVELLTDASALSEGKQIFLDNCKACHREDGGGQIGPNLTDNMWIYEGDIKGVFHTVSEGAQNGMIAWKNQLSPDKIQKVASYVLSLEPATAGKEAQGENVFERP